MRFSLSGTIRRVFWTRPAVRQTAPGYRPTLEALDGRTLLSSVTGLHIVASAPLNNSGLNATAEIAPSDVWAVGSFLNSSNNRIQPFAEHFNGTNWSQVTTPTPSNGTGQLLAVSAVASNDVWAVGSGSSTQPLIEQWNGTSWNIVPSPAIPAQGWLNSVTALAANNVWAVGFTAGHNLIEHFDGTSWSIFTAPTPRNSDLFGVSGDSASDVWAVGTVGRSDSSPELLHFNGTAWSTVSGPATGFGSFLRSVVALAPNNAWAVGGGLIEHFDGTSWSVVSSPQAGNGNNLLGVAAVSANNVWAVGNFVDPNANVERTLTLHFDGTSWSVISSPNVTAGDNDGLSGVTVSSTGDVVAVGAAPLTNGQSNPLILANNEPPGSTPVTPPTPIPSPSPSSGITDVVVMGALSDSTPVHGTKLHWRV